MDKLEFSTLLATSEGTENIRTEEFATFAKALISISGERPDLFQELGRHYERIGRRWLRYLERVTASDLSGASNASLAGHVERFVAYYRDYAPILWIPFVVEARYREQYPLLLDRVSEALADQAQDRFTRDAGLATLVRTGVVDLPDRNLPALRDGVRSVLEFSPRRTMAEEKDAALWDVAAAFERHEAGNPLFADETVPTPDDLQRAAPTLFNRLAKAHREHAWIAHWGYPPRYKESTLEEFLADVSNKIHGGAARRIAEKTEAREASRREFARLLRRAPVTERDRQLIADVNYYNFLRTYRMEVKIKAQYLSIPVFREIERRAIADGKLQADDIFLMVPPESISFLRGGGVPDNVIERRERWALPTSVRNQHWEVITGDAYTDFADRFFSVIDHRENARGIHNPTAPFVGGKGAGLFRLAASGYDPPPYFVVTTYAFERFLAHNGLRAPFDALFDGFEPPAFRLRALRDEIAGGEVPLSIGETVDKASEDLGAERIAVRSSAATEDAEEHSWAGRFESVLGLKRTNLWAGIKTVWASALNDRAVEYARHVGAKSPDMLMAVVIQQLADADAAGVINTVADPARPGLVEIEAALGFGSAIVNGEITPDRYLVDVGRGEPRLVDRAVRVQEHAATDTGGWRRIPKRQGREPKLSEATVLELAKLAKRMERDFGGPQDIEFVVSGGKPSIVQTRPQTGLAGSAVAAKTDGAIPPDARLVATGLKGKVANVFRGKGQVLTDLDESSRFIDGNVLVLQAATPAWDPVIFRASALVTNEGGATSHAIRVSNERAIPAVVGTEMATEQVPDGAEMVIDTTGETFSGKVYVLP